MCFFGHSWTKPWGQLYENIMSFRVEYFTANFVGFSGKNAKLCLLGDPLGSRKQIQAFPRFS